MRVPGAQTPFRTVHSRNGGEDVRRTGTASVQSGGNPLPQLGAGTHFRILLCRWLDATHRRRAIHPNRLHYSTSAGQHRPARRRHPGAARPRLHSGFHGHSDVVQSFTRLSSDAAGKHDRDLKTYNDLNTSPSGWWGEFPKYSVSLLKAWFGDAATPERDFCFDYLPNITGDHSHMNTVADMADGVVKGYFVMGENPVVGTVNGALHRKGLRELDWLVVRDFQLTETAEFWREAPEIERGEVRPKTSATEVFFFPAAAHTEKDGSFTNTQRLLQWHHKAIEPPGDCRSELDFMFKLGQRLKRLYADSLDPKDRPLLDLTWDYPTKGALQEPDAEEVLKEINGYTVADRQPVDGFTSLKDDGSTACGCWIYSGCYKDGTNQTARRKPHWEQNWVAPEWAWAWPHNRTLLYNRASADPDGKPWSERKAYVWWDEAQQKWTGHDEPDFVHKPPSYRPAKDARGKETVSGVDPFIMQADGKGWIFVPSGLQDGPLPTHYEPQESLLKNPLYGQQCNPSRMEWLRPQDNPYHQPYDDPRFPYVLTTYRLTEHHTAGGMSRWLTWLSELQPEAFCEVSPELAAEIGLDNGGWATIRSARAEIEARVLVTNRVRPLHLNGRTFTRSACRTTGRAKGWSAAIALTSCFRSLPIPTSRSWRPRRFRLHRIGASRTRPALYHQRRSRAGVAAARRGPRPPGNAGWTRNGAWL